MGAAFSGFLRCIIAKRRPKWFVAPDATPKRYAFFISYVAEDAQEAKELKAEIQALSGKGGRTPIDCFLDRHDWSAGNDSAKVMRDNWFQSQHMVLWATPSYLQSRRGWAWMELAYADLLEARLNFGSVSGKAPYIVSVFRRLTVDQIERTPLVDYWLRKLVRPDEDISIREIAQRLVDFHEQELRMRPEA